MGRPDTSPPFGSHPLRRVVPRINELLADPSIFLARESLYIGKLRVPRIMYVFALVPLGVLTYLVCRADPSRLNWGILLFCLPFLPIVIACFPWLGRRSILLRKDGVEIEEGDTVVWCPWSLFAVAGNAFVTDLKKTSRTLVLPVSPAAVAMV